MNIIFAVLLCTDGVEYKIPNFPQYALSGPCPCSAACPALPWSYLVLLRLISSCRQVWFFSLCLDTSQKYPRMFIKTLDDLQELPTACAATVKGAMGAVNRFNSGL